MGELLLNRVINDEIDSAHFLEWLTKLEYQEPELVDFQCSRTDFITYFLNYVHEDIGSGISEKKVDLEESKSSSEINRSHSFPLDLSSEVENSMTSTPKMTKVGSDSSVVSYMSPISPIYSFGTPRGGKSPICLGDFLVSKRVSSKKKRRIKPTNLSADSKNSMFHRSENSFNFDRGEAEEFPVERGELVEERRKLLSRVDLNNTAESSKKLQLSFSGEVRPELTLVQYKKQIECLVKIYVELLDNSYVLNLTSEIYFLVTLLLKKQLYNSDWGIEVLSEKITVSSLFNSVHNVVYFASKALQSQIRVLKNYDNSTIRLLVANQRLQDFAPDLVENLRKVGKPDRIIEIESFQNNVCFNSDTDNRQNFPNDPSFHAFRKQRDLFYDILRIWEQHHLSPGFDFSVSLGGKIKSLLCLSTEPTNFIHFARLFKAQLLSTCRNSDCGDFITSLDVDAQKLSKLKSRCVTKANCQGLNSLPKFSEREEFYKDFILVGANFSFNRHLADAFIEEITELNDTSFGNHELEDSEEAKADLVTKKSYYSCIKSLRILAKFLGFIESLPYKTESQNYSKHLLTTHLKIRQQIRPNFDVKTLLESSIRRKSVILCVPWLIKYLSMLDYVTLKLPYYTLVHSNLFWIYRNFDWGPDPNMFLIKFCLGWLFELSNLPDNNFLYFCTDETSKFDEETNENCKFHLDQLEIVDQNILYFCCPYLDEIKKLLSATLTSHSISVKHITPVTTFQSPDEIARKKLQNQLQEAFFNGQPISLRKTVEFVSERVASTCVKYVCSTLVPQFKKTALEKFKSSVTIADGEDSANQKVELKSKANRLAAACLDELQKECEREVETIAGGKVRSAIESLLSLDVLPQTKDVCVGITKKMCVERVRTWVESHVTLGIFTKDFNDEIGKMSSLGRKKVKRPTFMLPPGGTNTKHNDETISPAHLVEKYRVLTVQVIEGKKEVAKFLTELLDQTTKSINERGDFNQCIVATICTQLLDLFLLSLAHDPNILANVDVLSKSCDIWRLYYNGCDDLFKSLLCPRNVKFFKQSKDKKVTWDAFAKFCAYLIKHDLLSNEVFESQCTGIFRTDWDQETLKLITHFFKTFVTLYRDQGGSTDDFTFLLDFFSEYCADLI